MKGTRSGVETQTAGDQLFSPAAIFFSPECVSRLFLKMTHFETDRFSCPCKYFTIDFFTEMSQHTSASPEKSHK